MLRIINSNFYLHLSPIGFPFSFLFFLTFAVIASSSTSFNTSGCSRQLISTEILKVNGELVRNLQAEEGMKKLCEYTNEMAGKVVDTGSPNDVNYLVVSSWCKFGFYEVDFGFGKPVSFMYAGYTEEEEWQMNVLGLMDRREYKGIEAWLFLDSEIMDLLFNDEELLSYAVPLNP